MGQRSRLNLRRAMRLRPREGERGSILPYVSVAVMLLVAVAFGLMVGFGSLFAQARTASTASDAAALGAARAWAKSIEGMHDDAADAKNDEELWRGTGKTLDSYADSGLRAAAEHYAELNDATVTSMSVDAAHRQVTVSVRSNSSVEGTDKKMTSTSTAEIVLDKGVCLDHGKVGLVVKGKCQTKAPEPDAGNAPGKKATPSPSPAPSYSPPKGFENHVKISTRLVA